MNYIYSMQCKYNSMNQTNTVVLHDDDSVLTIMLRESCDRKADRMT